MASIELQINKEFIQKQKIVIDEETILNILKEYIMNKYGTHWSAANSRIYEYILPTSMGDIDDRTAIEAKFEIVTHNNG